MEDVKAEIEEILVGLKDEEQQLLNGLVLLEKSRLNQKNYIPRTELMKLVEDCIK